jgi:hypothetical protein
MNEHDGCMSYPEGAYGNEQYDVGLAGGIMDSVIYADPERWPILTRARKTLAMAHSPKVEWLIDAPTYETCNLGHKHRTAQYTAEYNYTMIFRRPVSNASMARSRYGGPDEKRKQLEAMLDDIEWHFQNGVRKIDGGGVYPHRWMGGVRDLLGRWPRKDDKLMLMILRDLQWRTFADMDGGEWLIELTLKAIKGGTE